MTDSVVTCNKNFLNLIGSKYFCESKFYLSSSSSSLSNLISISFPEVHVMNLNIPAVARYEY
jgi:hypothetical protein